MQLSKLLLVSLDAVKLVTSGGSCSACVQMQCSAVGQPKMRVPYSVGVL